MGLRDRAFLTGATLLALVGVAVHADAKSDALVEKARKLLAETRTMQADVVTVMSAGGDKQTIEAAVQLMRPNLARIQLTRGGPGGQGGITLIAGKDEVYIVNEPQKQYVVQPGEQREGFWSFGAPAESLIAAFFDPKKLAATGTRKYLGKATVNGKSYEVVQATAQQAPRTRKFHFGATGLVEGVVMQDDRQGQAGTVSIWLKNIRRNVPVPAERFAYSPQAGFEKFDPGAGFEATLLPVGKEAPEFMLAQPGGGQLSLEQARKGKKAVLINFWFHG